MRIRSFSKKESPSKLALGISLLVIGTLLLLGRQRTQTLLSQSFESEPVEISGFTQDVRQSDKIPQRIIIPSLKVDLEVRVAKVVNGYWEVFPDSAAWGMGSGLPGEPGNQVIFAHAREGLFLPLKDVKLGTRVYVLTWRSNQNADQEVPEINTSNWYSYEVIEIKEVYPIDTGVIEPTEDETLTLYTCTGFADSKRLIVVAKRKK